MGGGVTVRLRMAAALARLGHDVTVICNCKRAHEYCHVRYVPLDQARAIDADVLIVHSTAGTSVGGLFDMAVAARMRILLVDGIPQPPASEQMHADWVYPCSNFIAGVIQESWCLPGAEIFVSHHGIKRLKPSLFSVFQRRDPFRLIYTSHPSKGLDSAVAVTRRLRALDSRFVLHCYGGDQLWGGVAVTPESEEGIQYHGLVGQNDLLRCYARSGFAPHLQSREEPFGICLAEAMGAGCIVVASPVGAFPELVKSDRNGVFIDGAHESEAARDLAAASILRLVRNPSERRLMSQRASSFPLDWDTVAKTWTGHWNWLTSGRPVESLVQCEKCEGQRLPLADGMHCLKCGLYSRD